ncbi:phospholipid phosphatase 2-like isoform X2 [Macrobrachium rosenbergii]|uniref:phospholipid phosphatase 2-like isoform X2 n=1 Tax=Macrobrachium rosenbergii TaxID=79674 RepID=UPI0034D56FF7
MWDSKNRIIRLVLDVILYLSIFITALSSLFGPVPPPYFYISCDDPSIRRPYSKETVPTAMLISFTLVLPFIVMTAFEWAVPPTCDGMSPLRQGLRRSLRYLADLLIGFVFVYYITEIMKVITGEPRPHFWNVCAPNVTSECHQPYIRITWKDCTNPLGKSKRRVIDSMKSFPSGHATLSVFSTVFMVVYIKQRLWNKCSRLIAPWLQLMWVTWAIVCCQSRLWDNRHHWWDVLAGGLLGGFGCLLTLHYLSNWFIREEDCLENEVITADPNYMRHNSRFSQTSVKRLISTTSETDNHNDHRQDNRELTDINGFSMPEETMFSLLRL